MRGINECFINDLKVGCLEGLLKAVKQDDTLCLEIRNNYINIYYRGGNMMRVNQVNNQYRVKFDFNYCKHKSSDSIYEKRIIENVTIEDWVNSIPFIKAEMDLWFNENPKLEREFQQLILRDNNNSSIANDTDYYVSDIEYANSEVKCRFDILGLKWESNSISRKNTNDLSLAIMEFKYGDSSIYGKSGIEKHFIDTIDFINDIDKKKAIFNDAEKMYNQKIELGLINGQTKPIKINRDNKIELILLFANHKPSKTVLEREIKKANSIYNLNKETYDIKIAFSSFLGYGLYSNQMLSIDEFIKFPNRLMSK